MLYNQNVLSIFDKIDCQIWHDLDLLWLLYFFVLKCSKYDKNINFNWKEIFLQKWSYIYSQLSLAHYFRISAWTVFNKIKILEKFWFVESKNTFKYSLIVVNLDLLFEKNWKQNESKMKQLYNNKLLYKYIYINKNLEIFEKIIKAWNYRKKENNSFEKLEIRESIIKNFNEDQIINWINKYFDIFYSDKTFYDYEFNLEKFLKSEKWLEFFINANFENFLDWKKIAQESQKDLKEKRKKILEFEKKKEIEAEELSNKKIRWIKSKINELSEVEKSVISRLCEEKLEKFLWPKTPAIYTATFNKIILDKFPFIN